jgi:hypothetical protein
MGSFGGFYKGEKKKQKKGGKENKQLSSNAPVFVLPEVIVKKKKDQ